MDREVLQLGQEMLTILHIEKTAGTSLREYLYSTLSREAVFWWGVDAPVAAKSADAQSGKYVIGGHVAIHQYSERSSRAFVACIRDPVDRAVSFFSYIARIELAQWENDGFNPDDFALTLKHCQRFRDTISNRQTWYFEESGVFEHAKKVIEDSRVLIATQENFDQLLITISKHLDISPIAAPAANQGPKGYATSLNLDESVVEEVEALNKEDRLLREFISDRNEGLYCNIESEWWEHLRAMIQTKSQYQRAKLLIVEAKVSATPRNATLQVDAILIPGVGLPARNSGDLFVGVRVRGSRNGVATSIERRVQVAAGYFRDSSTHYRIEFPLDNHSEGYEVVMGLVDTAKKQWLPNDELLVSRLSVAAEVAHGA